MDAQQRDLLSVPYFHVVFTVPAELPALCLAAPTATYSLLFAAVAETLTQVARRRLGVQIAVTAILHTWTQLLLFHPHIHCIVPGGGLDPGHTHWIAARADFFLPVRILAEVFRGTLLATLETAIDRTTIPARCSVVSPHTCESCSPPDSTSARYPSGVSSSNAIASRITLKKREQFPSPAELKC